MNFKTTKILLLSSIVMVGLACAHSSKEGDGPEDQAIRSLPNPPSEASGEGHIVEKIPVEVNAQVENWMDYFKGRGSNYFRIYLERSSRYQTLMKKILRDNGVPDDLFYVAMIESGFSGKVRSRARAVGYWQFMPSTGRHYGLQVNQLVDERWDPVRSTEAAANYFKGLYNLFGSWYLAIASYNSGENRVKRLVMENQTRDFWELARGRKLPKETKNYIPKYIAANLMAREPDKYGFTNLDYHDALEFDVVEANGPVDMQKMAQSLGIGLDDMQDLNPAWKTQFIVPLREGKVEVRVPKGKFDAAKVALKDAIVNDGNLMANLEKKAKANFQEYRIRPGDSLGSISKKFGVSIRDLRAINDLSGNFIRAGRSIRVPGEAYSRTEKIERKKEASRDTKPSTSNWTEKYVVQAGDTLDALSQNYGTTVWEIKRVNRIKGDLQAGAEIKLPGKAKKAEPVREVANAQFVTYKVQPGDTLSAIADKFGVSIMEIKKTNRIRRNRSLRAGQEIRIPSQNNSLNKEIREVSSVKARTYKVRRGETLADLAKRFKISLSDLKKHNRFTDRKILMAGQTIRIPR